VNEQVGEQATEPPRNRPTEVSCSCSPGCVLLLVLMVIITLIAIFAA